MNNVYALSAAARGEKKGKNTFRRPAFTLTELLITVSLSVLIVGATVLLMGRGIDMVETNSAYTTLQNSALSSVEFLPKDIAFADVVEIVSNPSHSIEDALKNDGRWRYIAKAGNKVSVIYRRNGNIRTEPVTGSELVSDLEFQADVFTGTAARAAQVHVEVRDKPPSTKNVVLNRLIQIRAPDGVTGENGAQATVALKGPILRFYRRQPMEADLEIFTAVRTKPSVKFDLNMTSPDTWTTVNYDLNTQFDAALAFNGHIGDDARLDESEPPVFTWLVASKDIFLERLKEVGVEDQAAFSTLSPGLKKEKLMEALKNWMIPEELEYADAPAVDRKNLANELGLPGPFGLPDPFRTASLQPGERGYGYRVVEVSGSAPADVTPPANKAFRVIRSGSDSESPESPRFQWGKVVFDNFTQDHGVFKKACIVAIARYKEEGADAPLRLAAAVDLEEKERHLWDTLMDIARAKTSNQVGNGEYRNFHIDFRKGSVSVTEGRIGNTVVNYGRGKFRVTAAHSVGSRGSQMMMTLGDEYFKHLSPDLYGVTNYSVYIDKRLLTIKETGEFMPDGGMGVLLNGSAVETASVYNNSLPSPENFSSGYMFAWDPGAAGMPIRFNHYSSEIPRPTAGSVRPAFFDNDSGMLWGVQPMYAYDASKASPVPDKDVPKRALNAPAQILFFKYPRMSPMKFNVAMEDFEAHVLPPSDMVTKRVTRPRQWVGWGVYYRPPFLPRVDADRGTYPGTASTPSHPYQDEKDYRNGAFGVNDDKPGPVPMRIFSRGRNNIGLNQWNADANGWGAKNLWFGGSFGTSWGPGGVSAVYAFWHPQTWHLYDNMDWERNQVDPGSLHLIKDFVHNGGDWRSGWRFDIEYNLEKNHDLKTIDFAKTLPREWARRHILKLTVLEVTRDILAEEVEPEWRDRIHHEHYRDDTTTQLTNALKHSLGDVIHKAGDMFVRAELIQLKRATNNPAQEDAWIYDSRNWVYSKPMWFGKFRGDGWRGRGGPKEATTWSLFKRMGMSMMHLVADPEPEGGDAQSWRGVIHGESPADVSKNPDIGPGRGVRVRSWKDHFRGWPFSDDPTRNRMTPRFTYRAEWYSRNIEKDMRNIGTSDRTLLHPDLTFTDDAHGNKRTAPLIDKLENLERKHRLDGVWTPPVAIDLNGWALKVTQKIPPLADIDDTADPNHANFGSNSYDHQDALRPQKSGFSVRGIHYVNQWGAPGPGDSDRYETFGQYAFEGQRAEYERRLTGRDFKGKPAYLFAYNGNYTDMLYVRLSQLRPDAGSVSSAHVRYKLSSLPVWGLYAIRAWDYQKSRMGMISHADKFVYDFQEPTRDNHLGGYLHNTGEGRKRLLMVVQGLQLPYQPSRQTSDSWKYVTPRPGSSAGSFYLR
ncbi:MAG: hypothetical protein LBR71_05520, partial [Synergistaceae bacterium]|nr:hypothetical protein [Synergistaceae bacterium]